MNKTIEKYAKKHGFKKEWEFTPYSAWFERVAEISFGPESLTDQQTLPRDTRIRGACLELALVWFAISIPASFSLWAVLFVMNKVIHRLRRPSYYPQERERRKRLRAERRKIRHRTTQSDCPTPEALLAQFVRAKGSPEEMIRFGSMLEDLECYVDNSLFFDEDGVILGRQGGIRRWLQEHCLPLYAHYKTVMRYKAMAKKFRQMAGIHDPVPATALLDAEPASYLQTQTKTAKDFLAACEHTQIDLLWQLERCLSPEWIVTREAKSFG